MNTYPVVRSLIQGEPAGSLDRVATSENPARPDEPVARYAVGDAALASAAVAQAVAALPAWSARSMLDRGRVLRRAGELLEARADDFAALVTAEEGKTLGDAHGEVRRAIDTLHYNASSAWWPTGETFHLDAAGDTAWTVRTPVGVVAIVTPWNYPLAIPVWKLAPALVHGNSVVWKPATPTPVVAVRFAELLLEAGVDPGALSVVLGPGAVGAALVDDERVAAVSFTGSGAVGRQIAVSAARRGAKCQTELGGHNPAIVLADADLDLTVDALVRSVANGTGQKCTAARRIIVEEPVYDQLVDRFGERIAALRVGDGAEPGTDVGPLVNAAARDQVAGAIDRAVAEGCVVAAQTADVPDTGAYLGPTLLTATDQSAAICREEVFGPVTVAIPARDVDDALALAADTRFGLCASLFTRSERAARRAAAELPVGLLNINRPTSNNELHMPFGGQRESSTPGPSEQGTTARDFYTELRSVFSTAVT